MRTIGTLIDLDTSRIPKGLSAVYSLKCPRKCRVYVGSTNCLRRRLTEHKNNLKSKNGKHRNQKLKNAWNKCNGLLSVSILEEVDVNDLLVKEKEWMDRLNVFDRAFGLNLATEPGRGLTGYRHSAKSKRKMSESIKESYAKNREARSAISRENIKKARTPEALAKSKASRRRYTGEMNPFFGKTHDQQTREKMRGKRQCITGPLNPIFGTKRPQYVVDGIKKMMRSRKFLTCKRYVIEWEGRKYYVINWKKFWKEVSHLKHTSARIICAKKPGIIKWSSSQMVCSRFTYEFVPYTSLQPI